VVVPKGAGTVSVGGRDAIGAGNLASFSYPGADTGAYRTAAADGEVFDFGGATEYGSPNPASVHAPIVGMAVDHATGGYWLAASDGRVYSFHAPALGDAAAHPLNQPIVGIAATKNGDGYWLVARDGGIFAFGKARFLGSTGGMHLNKPIIGMARTDLRVRRAFLRIHRRDPSEQADRRHRGRRGERRLLARRFRRWRVLVQCAVLRVHRRDHLEQADRRDGRHRRLPRVPIRRLRRWCLQLRRRPVLGIDRRFRAGITRGRGRQRALDPRVSLHVTPARGRSRSAVYRAPRRS
jgi:hypothetical protein